MSTPLTKGQKAELAQLSNAAWKRSAVREQISAEKFRHEQVRIACSKEGLRCCTQEDYQLVRARLLGLLGRPREAQHATLRAATEPLRIAQAVLRRELRQAESIGITDGFAAHICASKYKCSLGELSARQTWSIIFDVRRSVSARRKKQCAEATRGGSQTRSGVTYQPQKW